MNWTEITGIDAVLFLEEKIPSVRVTLGAVIFVAGEAVGFSLPALADSWAWIGYFSAIALLAVYGLGVRHVGFAALGMLGIVLSLRTDCSLKNMLDANAGLNGPRPAMEVSVEGEVNYFRNKKTGARRADFITHVGPMPLKVIMPLARGTRVPRVGEKWKIDGWISRKEDKENRYARRALWVPESSKTKRIAQAPRDDARGGWTAFSKDLARRAAEGLTWCPDLAGLNRAILLGRRSDLSRERKRIFADAGTIHVFAISGLHVMVIAWLLKSTLARFGVEGRAAGLISIPLVWGYVVLTGSRPSAVRAATMATLVLIAPVLGRRPDSLSAWSVTVLAVYGLEPERFFDLGCALSFIVMFGIVLWCHWIKHFRPPFENHAFLQRQLGDFGVSFAAWVAGVPLAAYAFGRFTPGGLLANFVVLKCANIMVKLGAGALAVSFVCIPLAAILNNATAICTWTMTWTSECVATLPFSNFDIAPWTVQMCAGWYLAWFGLMFLLGFILPRRCRVAKKWW